jgi:hypothetical protein
MRRLVAAAALAALPAAAQDGAQDGARWGPVAEALGAGSGICLDGADIVCAVVLCEESGPTLGILGNGQDAAQPSFRGRIDVDGKAEEREMKSRRVMDGFLHVRTPLEPGGALWQRLRAGSRLALTYSPEGQPLEYTLRGSAAELDRVRAACR